MSFSINNSPSFKTDTLPLDSKLSKGPDVGTTTSLSGAGLGHTPSAPRTEFSSTLQLDGLNNAGVLTKLFDMFDHLISAMREMFSGKAEIVNRLADTGSTTHTKPDSGVQVGTTTHTTSQVKGSLPSEVQTKSKLEEGSQQRDETVAGTQTKATLQTGQSLNNRTAVETQIKSKLEEGSQQKDETVAGTQTKEELPTGVSSKVISDVANQLKRKFSEDSHQAETHAPGLRVLPRAREPGINVTAEANPQIKVEVNVNHCHCPETSIEAGKDSRAITGATFRTHAPLLPESPIPTASVKGHVESVITEGKDSHVEPVETDGKDGKQVIEGKDSHVESVKTDGKDGKQVTEGKHSHVESVKTDGKDGKDGKQGTEGKHSHVESIKTDGKDGKQVTEGKHSHVESVKTDGKDGKDGKQVTEGKDSHVESVKTDAKDHTNGEHDSDDLTGLHPHRHEVTGSDTSGSRDTTAQVSTRTTRGVTSPGPAENENDRWNQGFSNRSRMRG